VTVPRDHHAPRPEPVSTQEISRLITWMRRLSDAGISRADPAELAAFRHAKAELLARIDHRNRAQAPAGQPGDPVD
jgi:hypothetical protein